MRYCFIFLICSILSCQFSINAQPKIITITSVGIALTKEDAINKALVSAIEQVNGTEVSSNAASRLSQISKIVNKKNHISSSKTYESQIRKQTKGLIQSFRILEKKSGGVNKNMVLIKLSVNITKFKRSKQLMRKRIAVVPFRVSPSIKNKRVGIYFQKSLLSGIENYLTQTRRFAVLDRGYLKEQNMELNFIKSGRVNPEEIARIGNRAGVDFLIVGEILDAYIASNSMTMKATGQKIVSRSSGGKVVFRIIDVATTQIKYAETKSIKTKGGSIGRLGDALSAKLGKLIINAIYPIRIVSINDNILTLGQGGKTVKRGSVYNLIRYGKRIRDPYSKETLGRVEVNVGTIRIDDVQSKFSTARIIKLKNILFSAINTNDYIIRPINNSQSKNLIRNRKTMKQIKKEAGSSLKKLEKKSKDDW
jgi:hypothetical protein